MSAEYLNDDKTIKNIYGFDFLKVGYFYNNDKPLETRNGEKYHLCINFIDEQMPLLGESAYVVMVGDEIKYVGEYLYNLKDRWLRKDIYSWHHADKHIPKELDHNRDVTLWVSINPYIKIANDKEINISKSIEQEILKQHEGQLWNKRGNPQNNAEWIKKNCKRLHEILNVANVTY